MQASLESSKTKPEEPTSVEAGKSGWAEFNKKVRGDANAFLMQDPRDGLLVALQTLSVTMHCFRIMQRLGSEEHEMESQYSRLQSQSESAIGPRLSYLLSEDVIVSVYARARDLFESPAPWVFLVEKSHRLSNLCFAVLSKSVCGLEQKLFKPWRAFPFTLFKLLQVQRSMELEQVAQDILHEQQRHPCLLDAFSSAFLARFPSVQSLCSPPAQAALLALAETVRLDISRVECRHAAIRRLACCKKGTHLSTVEQVSAQYLLQQAQHLVVQVDELNQTQSSAKVSAQGPKVRRKGRPNQIAGGGGLQRALVKLWFTNNSAKMRSKSDKKASMRRANEYARAVRAGEYGQEILGHAQALARASTAAYRTSGRGFGPGKPRSLPKKNVEASSSRVSWNATDLSLGEQLAVEVHRHELREAGEDFQANRTTRLERLKQKVEERRELHAWMSRAQAELQLPPGVRAVPQPLSSPLLLPNVNSPKFLS